MTTSLITGTSSGLGLATALSLARAGQRVYATMRNLERAAELRDAAAAESLSIELLQLDVTDAASIEAAKSGWAKLPVRISSRPVTA